MTQCMNFAITKAAFFKTYGKTEFNDSGTDNSNVLEMFIPSGTEDDYIIYIDI